jgi:hypothetical protein
MARAALEVGDGADGWAPSVGERERRGREGRGVWAAWAGRICGPRVGLGCFVFFFLLFFFLFFFFKSISNLFKPFFYIFSNLNFNTNFSKYFKGFSQTIYFFTTFQTF